MGIKLSIATKQAWEALQQEKRPLVPSTFNDIFITQAPLQYRTFLQSLKPYINKATATDNSYSQNEAVSVLNVARKIVLGERPFFEGDEGITAFLNDIWAKKVNFRAFLGTAVNDLLLSGTTVLKLSINEKGQVFPKSYRADRVLFTTDYEDDIIDAFFYCGAFGVKIGNADNATYYYLIERRYFNEKNEAVTLYKVLIGTDVGGKPSISNIFSDGMAFKNLPPPVRRELQKIGVVDLNKEIKLPFIEGLGCYLIKLTASNAVSPEIPYGTPLLYGALPILHSIDLLSVKSDIDIEFSRALVMSPSQLIQVAGRFAPTGDDAIPPDKMEGMLRKAFSMGQQARKPLDSDLFEAVLPPKSDGTFDAPQFIQPDLMAEKNRYALETLETKLAIVCGFSPTSIFPNLADNSPKTATEVTAEENLTRATIHDIHEQMIPQIEKLAQEVLRQEGEEMGRQQIAFKMSDYIGNKLQADENTRLNYQAGLLPRMKAMQNLNGTTTKETLDDIQDILSEEKEKRQTELQNLGLSDFNDSDYYNEGVSVDGRRGEAEGGSGSDRGSENGNPTTSNQLQFIKQT